MRYQWTLRHFNMAGFVINSTAYDGSYTNEIKNATNRQVHFVLDNYEDLSFSVYLDDPVAAAIKPLTSVIKLWRSIYDDTGALVYQDPASYPCFSGYVGYVGKQGAENIMNVRVYSPLWRLKLRFHVNNHYFRYNPNTGTWYTESELIWKFIDLLQNAFPTNLRSFMGMQPGNFMWADDPTMGPWFLSKGTNGWQNIFDRVLSIAESPELIPRYYHSLQNPVQMYLDTDKARGSNKTASVSFNFHTGTNDNLDALTEEIEIQEGEFANYLWVVGNGGPNSGKVGLREQIDGSTGYDSVGVYQKYVQADDVQLFNSTLQQMAIGELKQVRNLPKAYSITVSPAITGPFYGKDYVCGDAVSLNANKGALIVANVPQRIYECTLAISDNNVETAAPVIGEDVKEHIISS